MKTTNKRILAAGLALILAFAMAGPKPIQAAKKQSIKLSHKLFTMAKKDTFILTAKTNPKKAKVKWKSSNKQVVTVSSKGQLTAISDGTATITATIKGTKKKATCKVIVGVPVVGVTVAQVSITINVGHMAKLMATATPEEATNPKLSFKSKNKRIATVDSEGLVKGVKAGETVIIVSSTDGTGKYAEVPVIVNDPD